MDGQRAVRHIYFMFFSQFPPLMEFRSRLVTAQVHAAYRPFFCKNKIGNSWLTNAAFHGILIDVDGALAQLVAHNTGSVGVRSSNLLCSTKSKKSEHHPQLGMGSDFFFLSQVLWCDKQKQTKGDGSKSFRLSRH